MFKQIYIQRKQHILSCEVTNPLRVLNLMIVVVKSKTILYTDHSAINASGKCRADEGTVLFYDILSKPVVNKLSLNL